MDIRRYRIDVRCIRHPVSIWRSKFLPDSGPASYSATTSITTTPAITFDAPGTTVYDIPRLAGNMFNQDWRNLGRKNRQRSV